MKKYIVLLASVFVIAIAGIAGISAVNSSNAQQYFASSGYVLSADTSEKITFTEQTAYSASTTGTVQFQNAEGSSASMSDDTFVHLDDGSVMALSDGVLLDFNDLSSNFINNYYTTRTLSISESGGNYVAETESGTITFGEHLWKLSDDKYIIRSSSLSVHFSDSDVRDAGDYVEVSITSDGIVQIMTEDDVWMTISESCYIETAGGVSINPVTKIIEDGTYQITINKLVVSADDSIVLTEDETRRQIVPEINIEAIDGEDGEDGTSGTIGVDGESGTEGEGGEDGGSGDGGSVGGSGSDGSNGTKGIDSTLSSSTNTALPSMSISEWYVTSTSLQGTIEISETGVDGLTSLQGSSQYPGSITITNVATGEVIYCYELEFIEEFDEIDYGAVEEEDWQVFSFYDGVAFSFTTMDPHGVGLVGVDEDDSKVLEPDTEYKLSVVSYYMINDIIYSREFITRTFYTDSTGVQMGLVSNTLTGTANATTTTANATVSVSATDKSDVTLYLLTSAQNASATLTTIDSSFINSQDYHFNAADYAEWDLTGLSPDTTYIVRSVVKIDGIKTLTDQELEITTLKRQPSYTDATVLTYYNRVNGVVEVYTSGITDYDDGITSYLYTVYDAETDLEITSKTVETSSGTSATFYLPNGSYYITALAYFDDNEKVTVLDLGESNSITITGSTLPKLSWKDDGASDLQYDAIQNTIVITMSDESYMQIDGSNPVVIDIYADQVMDQTITLYPDGSGNGDNEYYFVNVTPADVANTYNYVEVTIDLDNLADNTNYSFTVSGSVDLNDGNGLQYRTIGSLTVSTYEMNAARVVWSSNNSSSNAIDLQMSIAVIEDEGSTAAYTSEQLQYGAATVKLSSGSGATTSALASYTYTDQSDLKLIYGEDGTGGEGVNITEDTFNLPTLSSDAVYTLEVTYVVDDTYNDSNSNYENQITTLSDKTTVVTAKATPPDLSKAPETAVIATAITNENATKYGALYDETLDDDTIIGYVLESTYDNSQRLATTVTYYLFEYVEFYNAFMNGTDPVLGDADKLREITLDVPGTSDELPKVAVFFEDVKFANFTYDEETAAAGEYYYNYCYIYQGATLVNAEFDRGYRYTFAYTATYNTDLSSTTATSDSTYPYDHSDYSAYKNYYGSGIGGTYNYDVGVAYVLNSGMVSVPKADPLFASYVYETVDAGVTVHYTYNDIDSAIIETGTDITQISYENLNGLVVTEDINATQLGNDSNGQMWYAITIPYDKDYVSEDVLVLQPEVLIDTYVDDERYDSIFYDLTGGTSSTIEDPFYLAQIPVENHYGDDDETLGTDELVKISMAIDEENNKIVFAIEEAKTGDTTVDDLVARAYALKVTFSVGNEADKEFYLSIATDEFENYSATLSTSLISDFVDKTFTVAAEVYYDNGDQGWSLVKASENSTTGLFALQRMNTSDTVFTLSSYYTSSGYSSSKSNALAQLSTSYASIDEFISALQATGSADEEATNAMLSTEFSFIGTNSTSFYRNLTVEQFGVSDTTSSNINNVSVYRIVPKGVSVYALIWESYANQGTIKSVTPSVGNIVDDVGASAVDILSFEISAFEQIEETTNTDTVTGSTGTGRYVTVTVYYDVDGVKGDVVTDGDGDEVKATVLLSDTGTFKYTTDADGNQIGIILSGLISDTQYFYEFTAIVGESERVLLNTDTAEDALYSFETIDGIRITPDEEGVVYFNASYIEKTLSLEYSLNEYRNVTVTYEIYNEEDIQEKTENDVLVLYVADDTEPYLSYQDLQDANIMTEPSVYYENNFRISLTPSTAREKLVPGETYYLRIYAESGDANDEEFLPFTITAASTPSALVYAQEATSDTLSFLVSVVDAQYSLMNTGDATPFVVRFTDAEGNRIYTIYDSEVYYTNTAKQQFDLYYTRTTLTADDSAVTYSDETTLTGLSQIQQKAWEDGNLDAEAVLKEETYYNMYIYSLVDLEHDGLSYPTATTTDSGVVGVDWSSVKEASYFYSNSSDWSVLNTFVDTFWSLEDGVAKNAADLDVIEDFYAIASKTQSTTNADNFLLDKDKAALTYNSDAKFELILSESYGIVTIKEGVTEAGNEAIQTFKKIEYSIEGWSYSTGLGVNYYGSSLDSLDTDTLFVSEQDTLGFEVFTYELPQAVEGGSYTVTIKLYTNEDDIDAYETFTFNYR